jgi:hypothetical protein
MTGSALAQDPPADTSTTAPAPATPTWSAGPIRFSGLIDGYYSYNFNHPASHNNVIRNFDVKANQFSLNMAKLTLEHAAEPVGFRLDIAAGRAMDIFHATEPAQLELLDNLLQAYVSVKPNSWKGVQFDFGKFVTSAGSEVTETHLNWNYSRSLLYANGPYYHFGARTTVPIGNNFLAGVQLVNGWNNVEDNNSGKTVGISGALTTSKVTWSNVYYVGPEKTDVIDGVHINAKGLRHFYDTVLAINPSGRVNFLLNFDYGVDKVPNMRDNVFYGVSTALRFNINDMFAFSPRYDWYNDRDGFITGTDQALQEFTMTADMKMKEGFLARLEYRRDWSNQPFFDRGNENASAKSQSTLLLGFIVYFGGER